MRADDTEQNIKWWWSNINLFKVATETLEGVKYVPSQQ